MVTIGLDVHRTHTNVAVWDENRHQLLCRREVLTTDVVSLLSAATTPARVVMEAGTESLLLARELQTCLLEVTVVDCTKARGILKSLRTAKSDRVDAESLARAHARGMFEYAQVWVPDQATWDLRCVTRGRLRLVRMEVSLQHQIRDLLAWVGRPKGRRSLHAAATGRWLDELPLGQHERESLEPLRELLALVGARISAWEDTVKWMAAAWPQCALLQSLPGLGAILAPTIMAEIGTITRFPDGAHLASYAGLVPEVHQSGQSSRGEGLQDEGNRWLQWALVETAQHFAASASTQELSLCRWCHGLAMRTHRNVAKMALARRLTDVIYAMLRADCPFDPSRLGG